MSAEEHRMVLEGESNDIVQKLLLWASDGTMDLWKVWHDHYLAEDTHPLRLFENAEGLRYDTRLIDPCWPDLDFYVVIDDVDVAKASIRAWLKSTLDEKLKKPRIKPVPSSRI
jgi:hypothetical protein